MSKLALLLTAAAVLAITACGEEPPDPNALAAVKCSLPLEQKLAVTDSQRLARSDVSVRRLGEGRRQVTGSFTVTPEGRAGRFVCVVAPDASDKLRGLRVERLDVQEIAGERTER